MDWTPHMRRILERLGDDVAVTPAGGSAVTVRGLFLAPYHRALDLVPSNAPRLAVIGPDAATALGRAPAIGDFADIRGTLYRVAEVEADAVAGLTVLDLEVAA